jgi:hypothetical protein
MTVETHVADAVERVDAEREWIERRLRAVDRFESAVRDIDPASEPSGGMAGPMTDGGVTAALGGSAASPDLCAEVREAFAETVHPTAERAPSLGEALCDELGEGVALALSPESAHRFTPPVKESVLTAVGKRRAQLRAFRRVLSLEAESLDAAAGEVEAITGWLAAADETPLLDLGFGELQERHERLAAFRETCTERSQQRQATLARTISDGGAAAIEHESVVESLYEEFPTTYPVLLTVAKLDRVCADAQETVRDHITRRV